jgi:hypothetical protein
MARQHKAEEIVAKLRQVDVLTSQGKAVVCGPYPRGASRHRNPFLMTKTIPLITRRSSTLGAPCDNGKNGSIRRIRTSLRYLPWQETQWRSER